jgi:hypothetical protein
VRASESCDMATICSCAWWSAPVAPWRSICVRARAACWAVHGPPATPDEGAQAPVEDHKSRPDHAKDPAPQVVDPLGDGRVVGTPGDHPER